MVDMRRHDSWAYFPPNPAPDLEDEVIFVARLPGPESYREAMAFWSRRFPERRAFLFEFEDEGGVLRELRRPPNGGAE